MEGMGFGLSLSNVSGPQTKIACWVIPVPQASSPTGHTGRATFSAARSMPGDAGDVVPLGVAIDGAISLGLGWPDSVSHTGGSCSVPLVSSNHVVRIGLRGRADLNYDARSPQRQQSLHPQLPMLTVRMRLYGSGQPRTVTS